MNACVFLGPTLAVPEAEAVLDAVYLPPAKHGDLYRVVALLRPQAIGLIDGYFQWSAAVWHKEILWAIHEGIHVFGSSSMGALRAAELTPFGMRGVGRIFEAYRNGVFGPTGEEAFEDDDEVCVVHGPPETGYVPASEALVNIRHTLSAARAEGVIRERSHVRLLEIAKAAFFPERSYAHLLERGRAEDLPEAELAALERWLPSGRVNQKREDAISMLETMREFLAGKPPPAWAAFPFARTTLWERAVAALEPLTTLDPAEVSALDELRLDVAQWESMRERTLGSLLGTEAAKSNSETIVRPDDFGTADEKGKRRMEQAARREAGRRLRAKLPSELLERNLLARLREAGAYERLHERATDKQRCLSRMRLPHVEEFSELQLLELRDWYFSLTVGRDMPEDLERWIADFGYRDLSHFHSQIFAEFVYLEQQRTAGTTVDGHRQAT